MSSLEVLKGIFSKQVQRRKPIYDDVAKSNPKSAARIRGEDLISWQDSPTELTRGIGNYVWVFVITGPYHGNGQC